MASETTPTPLADVAQVPPGEGHPQGRNHEDVDPEDAQSDKTDSLAAMSSVSSTESSSTTASVHHSSSQSSKKTTFLIPTKEDIAIVKEEIVAAIPSKEELKVEVKRYYSDPINVAALVWYIVAIPALIVICLKSVGLLKALIPDEDVRHDWEEVALQLMNALFLLATLALFPIMARHTYLLIRWLPRDKVELRRFYCRNGKRKPNDRTHIAIVVMWGHFTAWSVLATCIYYLATIRKDRSYSVMMFLSCFSTAMSAGGILHLLLSPLSQEFDIVKDGDDAMVKMFERRYGFYSHGKLVKEAQWDGTLLADCCKDWKVACCSFFCPLCLFGANMEKLGFGNQVVHIFAFLVVLLGPVMVFEVIISFVKISDTAKQILAASGIFLSILGVAYGGLWRGKMRRRFHLPGSDLCCKRRTVTDVFTWLFCCWCALCQESRTISRYTIQVNREMDSSTFGEDNEDYEAPSVVIQEPDEGDWTYVIPRKGSVAGVQGEEPEPPQGHLPNPKEAPSPNKMNP